MVLAILAVAAIGLLFLCLVIAIIIVIRRRGQAEEEEMQPPLPEAPPYPAAASPPFAGTGPELGMAPTGRAAGLPGTELDVGGVAPAPSPTVGAGGPVPFGTTPSPPFAGPAAPPSPFVQPGGQPPPAGGTMLLDRTPRMSMVGWLIDRRHPDHRFDIAKPAVTIGRAQNCDVVVDHATVSRQHATIKLEEDQFRLYDLGSSNGTFVGEHRVREPVTLEDGATVHFGTMEYIFKIVSLSTGEK
ncbi:MAG: FHA domain-containing protein [Chloroflexi bacterium]|nr:FHA domain-containing protein [Chloroflexota bacterium]